MTKGIYDEIKKRISNAESGTIFVTTDFTDIASMATVRKCLSRQVEEKTIYRVLEGVYKKPVFSKLLNEYIPANPEDVAYALARRYHWSIAPCGDIALNQLGLSTQVPVVWSYISDGPYRTYSWGNITITFNHRSNRQITSMSKVTVMVVEALKTLGKNHVDDKVIARLQNRLPEKEKKQILKEAQDVSEWIYDVIRQVCLDNKDL